MMAESPRQTANPDNHLPFAGIVRCQECGSAMSVAFTNKQNKGGKKKYFYYRCGSVGHKGKDACRTKQIGADRLHDMVYKNLIRLSVDGENLKNLVFSLKNQTRGESGEGFEPLQDLQRLTPQNLQKDLTAYIKTCARKTGIEKVYAVRRGIRRIHYSKRSVRVDYAFGSFPGGKSGRDTSPMGANGGVSSDDVSEFRSDSHPVARSAFDQTNSTPLVGNLGVGRPGSDGLGQNSIKTKKPSGGNPLGSFATVCDFTNGGRGGI
ncbi:MAG: recombinase zinc beta ribbon domain-containing protein [Elusimicrobia bacterium]|nr:recombinase zinc beta ribbon domain-containing protein [Elusimicrobiota bacterium]